MNKTSKEIIEFIKKHEGFRSRPYLCPAGIPSIGYGETEYADGTRVTLNDHPITKETAEKLLMIDIQERERVLNIFLNAHNIILNINQFSALISFAYNVGNHRVVGAGSVFNCLVNKKLDKVPDAMKLYNKIRNKQNELVVSPALKERRNLEAKIFNSPIIQ